MDFGIAQISAITVVCYLAASIVKSSPVNNKWIPAICGGLGGILSVVGFFIVPDYPAENLFAAVSTGIVSGFAATGVNQAYKQIAHCENSEEKKADEEKRENKETESGEVEAREEKEEEKERNQNKGKKITRERME